MGSSGKSAAARALGELSSGSRAAPQGVAWGRICQVTLWLKKVYGDQPIPQYKVNARSVDILHQLAECNETRDRDISLLMDDMKQKTAEYGLEANYLQDLLAQSVNLSLTCLSKMGTHYLNALVDSAMALETKDTSLASFIPAINDLTSDLHKVESRNRELELELTTFREKLTKALVLEKRLQDDLKKTEEHVMVEKAKADSRTQNMKFLKNKSEDFKFRIKAAEEQLVANRMDPSLTHESLVSLSEKLAELKQQTRPLKKKLKSYLDLTPNPSLARVKIEEVKRELNALEEEFSAKVDMLALSVPEPRKHQFM
ncbi:HAUS augmin-like complex subunit 1 isoform X1 [Alligator sinensis]|uniref:HAUS augmin-like complex subunit 1 isoform X1 n=1 Tax=Alligator sinensis TaxID=38654 RepID=A0A1U7SBZ2_ALLSI|nr:HAUS augmin-like complex subunit 1 isoform X1 [Alligator sinensis]XP_014380769.1 HAUS augmin-like complex subunit 1 isoform X1 [Alligator sinensis]